MTGVKIPHPTSTRFHDDRGQPPKKRLKRDDSIETGISSGPPTEYDSDEGNSGVDTVSRVSNIRTVIPDSEDDTDDDMILSSRKPTELENALPQVDSDKEAIARYESLRYEEEIPEDLKARLNQRSWVKGKSSIYVDAFNLALGTVLEDEGHLFDEKEMEVFKQWQDLEYEAQYLYVLHLRHTFLSSVLTSLAMFVFSYGKHLLGTEFSVLRIIVISQTFQ